MTSILSILNELAATPGRNDKIAILQREKDTYNLKEVIHLALEPLITFGIKMIPAYTPNDDLQKRGVDNLDWAMNELSRFSTRKMTGNTAIGHLHHILENVSADNAVVIERIIAKDLRCGVAESTVNAVWPKLIFDFPIMKASPHDEKTVKNIHFPGAVSQLKLDGARCAIIVNKGIVMCLSSSGREIATHGAFDWLTAVPAAQGMVIDGELLATNKGTFLDRKTGNGIVNKAVKGTIPFDQAASLHFVAFDVIEYDAWMSGKWDVFYKTRLTVLKEIAKDFASNASLVPTVIVDSEAAMVAHYRELYAQGNEGTIVKDSHGIWENKRSKHQIKLKGVLTCDLLVVGVEEGTGKNAGKLGAIVCESADGLVNVNVGTGFSDADRALPMSSWVGKIAEVQYNERILSKVEGAKYSLFLPRFCSIRLDKDVADSISNISEKGE